MRWASEHFCCALRGMSFEDLHDCLCMPCPATPRSHSLFCFLCMRVQNLSLFNNCLVSFLSVPGTWPGPVKQRQ